MKQKPRVPEENMEPPADSGAAEKHIRLNQNAFERVKQVVFMATSPSWRQSAVGTRASSYFAGYTDAHESTIVTLLISTHRLHRVLPLNPKHGSR